ncbi:transcription/translation regulatory transformer protein RfaH [Candidatus Nucleicultrix amoebiphila]|jgi:transcriptional antiterminator RfaH|uniref:NusG-like N-terminal domain-containing protein n=1 Tax=Candidatus Nucleicultrix amoebiphila FS5 TaxID=1414854 RepID=A0A1W6N357_9PROT|nr:transcription/translation regulatory transformer protein RfaH [Candidatus Nucleicultrix amoebiphila]ARN84238.1 hypothetical protein GQ61_01555 [Candidatus Nucleicultrix amoebiphila FS5]
MKKWYLVYCQPSKELQAKQNLEQQTYEVYLPRFKRTRRHARRVETILAPLFPRYLFVRMDLEIDRWRSVNGTRGVSYLLVNEERPMEVPEFIIQSLKNRETAEGGVALDTLCMFIKGDAVQITDGAFQGYKAIFERMGDQERVHLLLNFLGRDLNIALPAYAIEAA